MIAGGPALAAGAACLIILASAIWAHYRFADYDRLPRQFGLSLEPKSYGPAWLMTWFLPLTLISVLVLVIVLPAVVPPEYINGDPESGVLISSVVLVAAQLFTLWLLTRWANGQG